MTRILYLLYVGTLLTLTLRPAFLAATDDAYPFSTYPMFASKRSAPFIVKAEGLLSDGSFENVPPQLVGTDEVMQAVVTIKRAARNKKDALKLCRAILKESAGGYSKVRIIKAQYDPIEYFVSGPQPLSSKTVCSCSTKDRRAKKKGKRNKSKEPAQ